MLAELAAVLADPDFATHPLELLTAWAECAAGAVNMEARYGLAEEEEGGPSLTELESVAQEVARACAEVLAQILRAAIGTERDETPRGYAPGPHDGEEVDMGIDVVRNEAGRAHMLVAPLTLRALERAGVELDGARFGIDAEEHEELLDDPAIVRAVYVCGRWTVQVHEAALGEPAAWRCCERQYAYASGSKTRSAYAYNARCVERAVMAEYGLDWAGICALEAAGEEQGNGRA